MTPSEQIDKYIASIPDWRGKMLVQIRKAVLSANPDIKEEWKWNSPVWSLNGLLCSMSAFKNHVGMHFFKGASLEDRHKLFNGSTDGKIMRSIKFTEVDKVREKELADLVREAIEYNNKK